MRANGQPLKPTSELVLSYVARFDAEYADIERALSKLFSTFSENDNLPDVLLKVVAVNSLYNTNIYATSKLAEHIVALNIAPKLASRSLDAVEEIASNVVGGKPRRFYSFATKYCNWHVPDAYPVYDKWVERLLWSYVRNDNFVQVRLDALQDYQCFTSVVERFRSHYNLSEFTFKQLDKFLWYHGKEVFAPAVPGAAADAVL